MSEGLYRATKASLSVKEALAAAHQLPAAAADPVALCYGPSCCRLARLLSDGRLAHPDGAVRAEDCYELRIFTSDWEIRWLRAGTSGQTAVLSKEPIGAPNWDAVTSVTARLTLAEQQLLWGMAKAVECVADCDGKPWTELTDARIGTLWVPFEGQAEQAVAITGQAHYEARDEDDGNHRLIARRLTGFEVVDPVSQKQL